MRLVAKARVQVTLDVELPDTWGPDCRVDQIQKQAAESARQRLSNELKHTKCAVVGDPKVTAILVEEDR